jgi:hypothetical protein
MRALAPEVRLWANTERNRPFFASSKRAEVLGGHKEIRQKSLKTAPQGLKPSPIACSTARLNPCPSFSEFSAASAVRSFVAHASLRSPWAFSP